MGAAVLFCDLLDIIVHFGLQPEYSECAQECLQAELSYSTFDTNCKCSFHSTP